MIGGIAGYWRWVRPRIKRAQQTATAIVETLVGREPIVDAATGKELVPAQPGMGVRLASVEDGQRTQAETIAKLTETVLKLDDAHHRLDTVETDMATIKSDVSALKAAAWERIATKAESAQMWRAVADADPDLLPNRPLEAPEDDDSH